MLFLDASALVKRYVEEDGSEFVIELTASQPVAISRLSATCIGRLPRFIRFR